MNVQTMASQTPVTAKSANPLDFTPRPVYLTVNQFSNTHEAFSPSALRNLIFKAEERHSSKGVIPGNGLIESGAIVRLGRKVLINEAKFFEWIEAQQANRVQ